MRIGIAGPGRSGTSLLVRLLGAWGLRIPDREGNWHDEAAAGLEARLSSDPSLEVVKDPWAYEYLERMEDADISAIDVLLVPIRRRTDAVLSRSVQERLARARGLEGDEWEWNSWGGTPGGAVTDTSPSGISGVLSAGLWDLLEIAERRDVPVVLLHFPRLAHDFDYLWSRVGSWVDQRISRDDAQIVWSDLVDRDSIRLDVSPDSPPEIRELNALVDQLRNLERAARLRADELAVELGRVVAERDHLSGQCSWLTREISNLERQLKLAQSQHAHSEGELDQARSEGRRSEAARLEAEAAVRQLTGRLEQVDLQLDALTRSRSWRVTRPLRMGRTWIRGVG